MSLRARLAALLFGTAEPTLCRDPRMPRVRTEIHGPVLTPEREAELREIGRAALNAAIERLSIDHPCS